jgi:hypothetical protein
MKLLPNEEKLITSNADKIILTNHRIQMTDSVWGQSFTVSIFLEDISSIEIKYKSNILLIILGVICVLGGFYMAGQSRGSEGMIGGLVLGAIFFAIWWFTRKHIISIASDGGASLNFMVQGMGDEKINDFIHNVSLAKQTRVNQLAKL